MGSKSRQSSAPVRPLATADLERVIEIDEAHTGRSRRRFFEKRFRAVERNPEDFIHVAVDSGGKLVGFGSARILRGEFGRQESVVELDAMGVDPGSLEHGHGHALLQGLLNAMRQQGLRRLHSQAEWTNHRLLSFFGSAGFELASRLTLERNVGEPLAEPPEVT